MANSKANRHAVIDIGSNTVRLGIFPAPSPHHHRIVSLKARCRLAEGLDESGNLSPRGIKLAMETIAGYTALTTLHRVKAIEVVATSAVREARDGKKFARRLEKKFSFPVHILTGDQEAKLCARGIISGLSEAAPANGLVADLGGGSLEIAEMRKRKVVRTVSLPLGHIWLSEKAHHDVMGIDDIVNEELAKIGWVSHGEDQPIYLSGGGWRKLARIHAADTARPHVIEGYRLKAKKARKFAKKLCKEVISGDRELSSAIVGARVMKCLIKSSNANKVIFSTRGLMDGCHAAAKELAAAKPAKVSKKVLTSA